MLILTDEQFDALNPHNVFTNHERWIRAANATEMEEEGWSYYEVANYLDLRCLV